MEIPNNSTKTPGSFSVVCPHCASTLFKLAGRGSVIMWTCAFCSAPTNGLPVPVRASSGGQLEDGRRRHFVSTAHLRGPFTFFDVQEMCA